MTLRPAHDPPAHDPHARATPSRRSVLRAAAWSVPAVSVVVAAPAYAASGPVDPVADTLSVTRNGTLLTVSTRMLGGSGAVGPLQARVLMSFSGGSSRINATPTAVAPWAATGAYTATSADFVMSGVVAANAQQPFSCTVNLNNASFSSVRVDVVFSWPGGTCSTSTTYVK